MKLGVYRAYFFKDLDADTRTVTEAALEKLKQAGVTIVEVDMPDLQKLNDGASFPVALYEAYDDLKAYLERYRTGLSVEQVAAQIASKDVKGTYDGLVMPRKLPAPNGVVDAAPVYKAAMEQARPALLKHFNDTFAKYGIDALVGPTTPARRGRAGPGGEQPADVPALHPQHGSGQQRRHPGTDDPRRPRPQHGVAGRALARRPARQRRAPARARPGDRESARPHAAAAPVVSSSGLDDHPGPRSRSISVAAMPAARNTSTVCCPISGASVGGTLS